MKTLIVARCHGQTRLFITKAGDGNIVEAMRHALPKIEELYGGDTIILSVSVVYSGPEYL